MENQTQIDRRRKNLFILSQILIVILAIAVGYLGRNLILRTQDDLALLHQAQEIVIDNALVDTSPSDTEMEYGMIQGMLTSFGDPYTVFVPPAAHEVETNSLAGSFGGVGMRLERDSESNWRVYPLPDSPALAAGIQNGDILTGVDDLLISPETNEVDLLAAVRGPVGESVTLTLQRNETEITVDVKRESVPIPSVVWNLVPEAPEVGLIHVYLIAETTADEIANGIADLQEQGAAGFILDLRNNGGGLVNAGVDIARLFLSEGDVLHEHFKGERETVFEVKQPGPFTDLPLVVLVNGNTASSAEIVAGALAAQDCAPLIGAPTFGKTTVQYIFDLQDGSSIHVTSGRWWIPGESFPLQPDVTVGDDPEGTAAVGAAVDWFNTDTP
jgi:carboxyl-terminal processing protease